MRLVTSGEWIYIQYNYEYIFISKFKPEATDSSLDSEYL